MKFFPYVKGGLKKFRGPFSHCVPLPPIINGQSLIIANFECLVLLSSSEMKQEVCKLLILISQGIDRYKVLVVRKNGKLNETIEVSALWSK